MPLTDAHALSHVVKDRLMARYPQIADAIIHIEPPPQDGQIGQVGQVGQSRGRAFRRSCAARRTA